MFSRLLAPVALTACGLALAACGGSAAEGAAGPGAGARGGGGEGTSDGSLQVVAAFYPLQFVTARVAGDRATVAGLTSPGAEPHDLELSPRAVATLADADLVVYQGGFQPAVDDALAAADADGAALDVAPAADLDLTAAGGHEDEEGHDDTAEPGQEPGDDHGDDHGDDAGDGDGQAPDPHFWLDPRRLSAVAQEVGDRLTDADPEGAEVYAANTAALVAELADLDTELEAGLATCTERTLVTSHQAFGYLAERYGFEQLGISGLSPDEEPDAGEVAEVARFVRENGVGTIYFETLVSPAVAEAVASETGARTAVLDPVEGLTDESAGDDYLEVQRANLAALRAGQSCS